MEADPYIIAQALNTDTLGGKPIIITQESDKPNKIPDIAKKYNIESIKNLEFFEKEGWSF